MSVPAMWGNIIRFQPVQRLAPPEHPLQQPQRAMLPLLLIRDALGLLARIFVRQFHELDVVAALRG